MLWFYIIKHRKTDRQKVRKTGKTERKKDRQKYSFYVLLILLHNNFVQNKV